MNLLGEINRAGLLLSLAGDRIKVDNPSKLTDDLRNLLRANKREIIRLLSCKDAPQVYCYRVTDKPNAKLTVIMPGTELEEATEHLQAMFGSRLLEVMPSPHLARASVFESLN
jgi:hypothetical protein